METVNTITQNLERSVETLIRHFDKNAEREGLQNTPARYVKFLGEFLSPPEFNFTTFDAEGYDEMIIQTNIPFYSLCEHHLVPFFGVGHIAYIPNRKIVGLSKLARVLDKFSRSFQNQERITQLTAEFLQENLLPQGVAVVLTAQHLCMAMRGVKKHDTWTTTSKMLGAFYFKQEARQEFLQLIKNS
jgi:GTP cyclohydrolase IA